MENIKRLIQELPDAPGVYIFRGPARAGGPKRSILYIGKATSLRARVASYFNRNIIEARGPIIASMIEAVETVDFIKTDSVLEALILEAHLIKKHKPPYNTKEKDNKSFNFVVITEEKFPRVLIVRGRNLDVSFPSNDLEKKHPSDIKYSFGPFPQGSVLREALSIVRKIFPFRDKCKPNQGRPCFNAQIGLCPGVCAGKISQKEYAKTIQRIKLFFEGKKKTLINGLECDMKLVSKNLEFEEARRIKKMIFALKHIQDVALLKRDFLPRTVLSKANFRIEAYDIAHISGAHTVGVMVVIEDGEVKKSDYRKFKIRTSTNDDNASLREILSRRFEHTEWPMPKLIVVDGGKAQVGTAEKALKEWGIIIPIVGVVKNEHHKPKGILYGKNTRPALENLKLKMGFSIFERTILLANSEAHRFAIAYHQKLRGKIK